ncbi:hypothetical protein [Acidipropionibacterium jensenii]|uniref:hypothetical protein n=1 Tax=Acidipropionibacterium jensenii TaxID=1749 RepID=UPI00214C3DA1|nr:hypothetical protein [Acidipropionibacterium jensenii]
MPERSNPQFHDTVRAITDLLDPRHCARRSGGSLMLSVREVATRMAEAGWRPPTQNTPAIADPEATIEDRQSDELVVVPADLFDDVDENELVQAMTEVLR